MERTLKDEDTRKTKLFEAWMNHFQNTNAEICEMEFEEIYEDMTTISDLTKDRISFHLNDGRKLPPIPITRQISENSYPTDLMFVILGRQKNKWWILDVISVGSMLPGQTHDNIHMSFNPIHVEAMAEFESMNPAGAH